ncbi:hypothetical protein [Tamlana flava]|uniref:hypothetical protein n=1 Tax=Tamlana flava TaxID=3158572 RepID=UPI00351B22A1
MKNIIFFAIASFTITYCQGQVRDRESGLSLFASTNDSAGIDFFGREGNSRIHFGYSYQFNGQKNEIKKKQGQTDGLTEDGKGDYFWVIDLGYSRIFIDKLTVHSELSIGGKKEFTNFLDDRYSDDGYSLITSSKAVMGVGLNMGYLMNNGLEPFIGIHTLKKINIGVRLSW